MKGPEFVILAMLILAAPHFTPRLATVAIIVVFVTWLLGRVVAIAIEMRRWRRGRPLVIKDRSL